jgi:glyoxylase-like metal-dependent hydrolase (beta-lactamase superfamily II)
MKIGQQILENVYYFNESMMLDCNMYIIKNSDEKLLLIDTGNGRTLSDLSKAMGKLGLAIENINEILITHEHMDHILGLYSIFSENSNFTPIIYAHEKTAKILQEADEKTIMLGIPGISAEQFGITIVPLNVEVLNDGDTHNFGNISLNVYATPGHSNGSLSYYDASTKTLFPGDVVFPEGSFGRYDLPGGSIKKLIESINVLSQLDVEYLCAGHMDPINHGTANIQRSLRMAKSMEFDY